MNDDANASVADHEADRLRGLLDSELAALSGRPEALQRILTRAQRAQREGGTRLARAPRGHGRPGPRARLPQWAVAAAAVAAVAVAVPLLRSAREDLSPRPSNHGTAPFAATTAPSISPRPAPSQTTVRACTAERGTTARSTAPSAASPALHLDLDGDGANDTVTSDGQHLRVHFAAGGTSAYHITTPSGWHQLLAVGPVGNGPQVFLFLHRGAVGGDGSVGANAEVMGVVGCRLQALPNMHATPYTIWIGGSTTGERRFGVWCQQGALLGVLTTHQGDGRWRVTPTPIEVRGGTVYSGTAWPSFLLDSSQLYGYQVDQATCGAERPIAVP